MHVASARSIERTGRSWACGTYACRVYDSLVRKLRHCYSEETLDAVALACFMRSERYDGLLYELMMLELKVVTRSRKILQTL